MLAAQKRTRFCGVGFSGFAVQPNGDVFICHRFASEDNFKIGNVLAGIDETMLDKLTGHWNVHNSPSCSQCWARHLCGGGCYAENYYATGDTLAPCPERCHSVIFMLYHVIENLITKSAGAPVVSLDAASVC